MLGPKFPFSNAPHLLQTMECLEVTFSTCLMFSPCHPSPPLVSFFLSGSKARLLIPHPCLGQITVARKSSTKTVLVLQPTPGSPNSVSRDFREQQGHRTDLVLLPGWPVSLNAEIPVSLGCTFLYSKIATVHMAFVTFVKLEDNLDSLW